MRRAVRARLDRLAHRLGPRGALTRAEARELAALEAEQGRLPPLDQMSEAELDARLAAWGWGKKGARLRELQERARPPAERRATEELDARFDAMSDAALDRWLAESVGKSAGPPSTKG